MKKYIYWIVLTYLFTLLLWTTYAANCKVKEHDDYDIYNILDTTENGDILYVETSNVDSKNFERKITFKWKTEDYSGYMYNKWLISPDDSWFMVLLEKSTWEFKPDYYILKDWELSGPFTEWFLTNFQYIDWWNSYVYLEEVWGLNWTYYLYINWEKQDFDDVEIITNNKLFSFLYRKWNKEYIKSGWQIIYERNIRNTDKSIRLSNVYFSENWKDYIYTYDDNWSLHIVKNWKILGKYPENSFTNFINDDIYIRYNKDNKEYLYKNDKIYDIYKDIIFIGHWFWNYKVGIIAVPENDTNFTESDRYSYTTKGNFYLDWKLIDKEVGVSDLQKYYKSESEKFTITNDSWKFHVIKWNNTYYSTENKLRFLEESNDNKHYTVLEYKQDWTYFIVHNWKKIEWSTWTNKFSKYNDELIYFTKNEESKLTLNIGDNNFWPYKASYIYDIFSFENIKDIYITIGEPFSRKLLHYKCDEDSNNKNNSYYNKKLIDIKNNLESKSYGKIVILKIDNIISKKSQKELNIILNQVQKIKKLSNTNNKYKKYLDIIINYLEYKFYTVL